MKGIRLAALVVAACLTACGGAPEPGGGRAVGGASGTELAARQVLHLGNGPEAQSLDPHRTEDIQGFRIQRDLFEGLVDEAPNGDLIPGAAESWTISDDGKTYTFHLRRNARWSNGEPVTAHDFVYGFKRALDPQTRSVYTFILTPIVNADAIAAGKLPPDEVGARALDDYTLEITLTHPTPYFLGLLTNSITYPVHRASVETYGVEFTRPGHLVGNGAFKLDEWVIQSHMKLVRNPYYWDNAETRIEEIWFYPTDDLSAELKRYRADELDFTHDIPTTQFAWIKENLGSDLKIAPYLGSYYFSFNLSRPPFKDNAALRRALSLAVDRDILTKQVLGVGQEPAYGFVPPVANYTGQVMKEASWTQGQREAEAKRLYTEAGYSADHPLHTKILHNSQEDHRRIAVTLAAMWREVLGVEAEIESQEWKVFLDTRNEKLETQVFRSGWIGDYNDAFAFAELMRGTSDQNDSGYANPEYDRLVTAAQSELDAQKRAELLEEAESVLLEDMPIIPLYFYVSKHLIKPWVRGYEPNIMDRYLHKDWYVLEH